MDCGVDTIERQDETGAMRGVEIIPKGCTPVSEDVCKSGFMAPSNNVTFPIDSLEQCCKCKVGESCSYCKNPLACTEDEQRDFVTEEDCFGAEVPSSGPSSGPSSNNEEEPESTINVYLISGLILGVAILFGFIILLARAAKTTRTP
jgi:hypothetical protein